MAGVLSVALLAVGSPAFAEGPSDSAKDAWIEKAEQFADYDAGVLESIYEDEDRRDFVVTEVKETQGGTMPASALARLDSPSGATTMAACGTRKAGNVWVKREHIGGGVLFSLRVQKNFSYDGCRTWHESTQVTPYTSKLGQLGGYSYNSITASVDGYEFANSNANGRTYTERTAKWNDSITSRGNFIWVRMHANWNGTHGGDSGMYL
ncbi:hypothetical protein [Oerskovia merdavium]|uniref:Uncharacterized protein n=1 Tax=Oerskovia merdavium TaxID=2762227 RepID=A0ABR8U440_9CELL|nr:hypothetical protein [Oerskovia merdavium]MBD7982807.1 hypothetical protein [Oerskovia merdavium]